MQDGKISSETVRGDFNDPNTVIHYARAAHFLGLWKSERKLIARFFTDHQAPLLEAGCGAGRVTVGLHDMGYKDLCAFDFAEELLEQAGSLMQERGVEGVRLFHGDATRLQESIEANQGPGAEQIRERQRAGFAGALFMFNGLMQIPGRENRRRALRCLAEACVPGAPLLFTTHDRDCSKQEQALWRLEALRWEQGRQDARLVDFGDRYFEDETGRTFMHLPVRQEILEDLEASGWEPVFDAMRRDVSPESVAVKDFSDECRFWAARRKSD